MPTKRTRVVHARNNNLSDTALYYASDGFWGDPPERPFTLELMTYKYPTVHPNECRAVWLAICDELLPAWIKEHPGTRPTWWYLFDPECPRMTEDNIRRHGWEDWFFAKDLPDLRKRLGGIGDPRYEHWSLVPTFHCAVPDDFVSVEDVSSCREEGEKFHGKPIDPRNPPRYESQAAYLKRHGLLTTVEKQRLRKKDFEPTIAENRQRQGE